MADNQDFAAAFDEFATPDDKKPAEAAAAGAEGGDAAASGGADDQGAGDAAASGSAGGDADSGDGGAVADAGGEGNAEGDGAAAAAGAEGAAGEADPSSGDGGAGSGAGDDAGAAAGADAGAGASPGADPDAILEGLRKLVGEPKPAEAAAEGGEAAAVQDEKPLYSKEDQEFLDGYEKDWADVARGEALKRRAEYQQLLQHVFTQVANFVKPLQETAEVLAERSFVTDVKSAVPDYSDQLRDSVVTWVKTQPAYLQMAYNQVITEGTVDEVKDLIERYRTATGAKKPAGAGGAKKPNGENELSGQAKQAATELAPVDSKRSGVQAPGDPSSFDDAWKQAATDLG